MLIDPLKFKGMEDLAGGVPYYKKGAMFTKKKSKVLPIDMT